MHFSKLIAVTIYLTLTPGYCLSQQLFSYNFNGVNRTYYLYRPDNLQQNAPLVFVLHGNRQCFLSSKYPRLLSPRRNKRH